MAVGLQPVRDEGGFASRHRFLLVLLWIQVPTLAAVGLVLGEPVTAVALSAVVLVATAVSGMLLRSPSWAAIAVALGLVAASGIVAHYSNGQGFSHFHFFLMICAISFYREWLPLGVAVLAVAAYHFVPAVSTDAQLPSGALHTATTAVLAVLLGLGWRIETPSAPDAALPSDRFRLSFEEAPIGMAVLKPSGEFLEVNGAMAKILGYQQEALVGANITGLVHVDDQGELGEAWELMGNSPTHTAIEWMRCLTATGHPIWGRVSLSLVPRTESQQAMVILQLEDVTRTYEEQRRLETLSKGKDEFVAAVSEEIRQPLGLLIDLTDTANHAHVDVRQALPRIGSHAKEIASIVDDLVVAARAESAPPSVVAHLVDAETLCREVLARIPGTEHVTLEFGATWFWGDPALARQIVNNLVVNAVRYGGREVSLRTISSGPDTVIQVFDNGPEIPGADRERIFSGDLRSGEPVTRPAAVGLGLSVGRLLARMMDGDVVYRRTQSGENLFELRLPSERISELPRRRGNMRGLGIPV